MAIIIYKIEKLAITNDSIKHAHFSCNIQQDKLLEVGRYSRFGFALLVQIWERGWLRNGRIHPASLKKKSLNVVTEAYKYHIPMPAFVFVGFGTTYQIFAVKKRPLSDTAPLYHVPCPNVHTTGGICQGNTPFPNCSPQTIQQACQLFLEGSSFNADLSRGKCHSYPEDVRELWAELNGRKRFPLSELVPAQRTIHSLL